MNGEFLQRFRIYKKSQIDILEIQNIILEIKNLFTGFDGKLETAEHKISELYMSK